MFKFFYKKTLLMVLFLFLAGAFVNEEKAYASELIVSDLVEKSIEELQTGDQFIKADSSITDALAATLSLDNTATLFCTSDTPDNIVELMTSNATEYEVLPYSFTNLFRTTGISGIKVDFLTIQVSGEVYIYTEYMFGCSKSGIMQLQIIMQSV